MQILDTACPVHWYLHTDSCHAVKFPFDIESGNVSDEISVPKKTFSFIAMEEC